MAKKKSAKSKANITPRIWSQDPVAPSTPPKNAKAVGKPLLSGVVSRATNGDDMEEPDGLLEVERIHDLAQRFHDILEDGVELLGAENAAKFFLAATAEAFGGAEGLVDSIVKGISEPTSQLFRLRISLVETKPLVERVIDIPDCNLGYLHEVIQDAFGWSNSHLHIFEDGQEHFGPLFEEDGIPNEWDDECEVLLSDLIGDAKKKKFSYTYDFGDDWKHQIELISREHVEKIPASAVCISGKCAGPPEDCGGIWGYQDLLDRLHKRKLTEEDFIDPDFDPNEFDLKELNSQLKRLKWKEFH